jgi:alkaline phosphatase
MKVLRSLRDFSVLGRVSQSSRVALAILLLTLYVGLQVSCTDRQDNTSFDNVIVLIPDGCGTAHMTIARWVNGAPLAQDSMEVSLVRTYSANSMITGSDASATAYATGYKTWEHGGKAKCLSMRPDSLLLPEPRELSPGDRWMPAATVLEGARLHGKAVGLVATSRVSHATPAAYAAHWHDRGNENVIMEQMVYQGIDVALGGGYSCLIGGDREVPGTSYKGRRADDEDLASVLRSRGYEIVTTRDELDDLREGARKVFGLFSPSSMAHHIDRVEFAPDEPSLAEMTETAIEILSRDPDGFFLMIEGSQVDWSSHDNDPVGTITDYLAFDEAVDIALDFARSHPRTLVLLFPDHDNGGMSLGRRDIDSYDFQPNEMVDVIEKASLTADGVGMLLWETVDHDRPDRRAIRRIVSEHFGIDDLTEEEVDRICASLDGTLDLYLREVLGPILSERAGIGWTTFSHTGHDVPLFTFGLENPPGTIDNTELAGLCARALGFDLDDVNKRLIVDAEDLFEGASVTLDTSGVESSRGTLIVEEEGKRAEFPFFKNLMIVDRDTVELEGLTLYSLKSHSVFLPREAREGFDKY